jgi:hypothetical protein
MAQIVKYKKPSRINVVSVTLVLGLTLLAYLGSSMFPCTSSSRRPTASWRSMGRPS